jgi:hypothetical protein
MRTEGFLKARSLLESKVGELADKVNSIRLARAEQHSLGTTRQIPKATRQIPKGFV